MSKLVCLGSLDEALADKADETGSVYVVRECVCSVCAWGLCSLSCVLKGVIIIALATVCV